MAIWLVSDQHFNHRNIIQYSGRPFRDVEEMNAELIRRHNETVEPHDVVWHLGDFSLDEKVTARVLPQLNGQHHLVTGNHDACHSRKKNYKTVEARYVRYGFRSIWNAQKFADGTLICPVMHEDGTVLSTPALSGLKPLFRMAHMPYGDAEDPRYPQYRPPENQWDLPLVHGHVHEKFKIRGRRVNIGVDQWDYRPVALAVVAEICAKL